MGTLEQFVKDVFEKVIAEDHPHLKYPAVSYATVTASKQLTDTYTLQTITITDDGSGSSWSTHCVAHLYEYNLRVVDRFGNINSDFPEIPGVRSKAQLAVGAIVAVGFVDGEVSPVIIEEVSLERHVSFCIAPFSEESTL